MRHDGEVSLSVPGTVHELEQGTTHEGRDEVRRVGRGGVDIEDLRLEADVLEHTASGRPLGVRPSRDRDRGGPRGDREEPAPTENVGGAAPGDASSMTAGL